MDKIKICGNCYYYTYSPLHGPLCQKNRKEVSYLQTAFDCWTSLEEKPTTTPAPTPTPEPTPATTSKPDPKRSRGGRVSRHPKYVDRETGHTMKWCTNCNQYKPIDDFHLNKSRKDGHANECKLCHNAWSLESQKKRRAALAAKKAAASEAAAPAAPVAPVKTPEKKPVKTLASYTDKELCEELAARGWVVTLRLK